MTTQAISALDIPTDSTASAVPLAGAPGAEGISPTAPAHTHLVARAKFMGRQAAVEVIRAGGSARIPLMKEPSNG
jgi:hypothetical protein